MKAWAIEGEHGLYYGTYSSRADAIGNHVRSYYDLNLPFYTDGALSKTQKLYWNERRKKGDRAVRVTVSVNS